MDRLPERNSKRPTRRTRRWVAPLIWIAILLTSWAVIAEWRMLPELVGAATAALP
jgi:hypothetical protein